MSDVRPSMQGPIEEPSAHRQASDFLQYHKPELPSRQSTLLIDLPAHYDLDKKYTASPVEIWSFCLYLVAGFGVTLANFAPTAFQNLLAQAAGDAGVLHFAGR